MLLGSKSLLDQPQEHEGMTYYKGIDYLALALTETGWSMERVEKASSELLRFKSEHSFHRHS